MMYKHMHTKFRYSHLILNYNVEVSSYHYRESIIEGIEVIQETSSVKKMQSNQELVTLEDPSRAHLDIITDIAIVGSSYSTTDH